MILSKKKPYCPPVIEEEPAELAALLCVSPETGGIEDVEFEDWTK